MPRYRREAPRRKNEPLVTPTENLISMQISYHISYQTGFNLGWLAWVCLFSLWRDRSDISRVTRKFRESRSFAGTGASKTPVKILRSCLDDFCRVCNVDLRLSGQGKFNLFEGETSKKQNVSARLSSVLGIPVEKEQDASSRLCFKCKREMEKLETLSELCVL